jgi:hypothetical protein
LRGALPCSSQRSQRPRCDRAMRRCDVARLMLTWHCELAATECDAVAQDDEEASCSTRIALLLPV